MCRYLKIVFIILLFAPTALLADSEKGYRLDLLTMDNTLQVTRVTLQNQAPIFFPSEGNYEAQITSFRGRVLWKGSFDLPKFPFHGDVFDEQGRLVEQIPIEQKLSDNVKFLQYFPYFPNAKSIDIYNSDGSLALSADVSQYATNKEQPILWWQYVVGASAAVFVFLAAWYIKRRKNAVAGNLY